MRRNWNIVEQILKVAATATGSVEIKKDEYLSKFMNRAIGEDPAFEVGLTHNINLLKEAGYIRANTTFSDAIGPLTWKGNNLLDEYEEKRIYDSALV